MVLYSEAFPCVGKGEGGEGGGQGKAASLPHTSVMHEVCGQNLPVR